MKIYLKVIIEWCFIGIRSYVWLREVFKKIKVYVDTGKEHEKFFLHPPTRYRLYDDNLFPVILTKNKRYENLIIINKTDLSWKWLSAKHKAYICILRDMIRTCPQAIYV